jgi:ATP-dependent Zn protease
MVIAERVRRQLRAGLKGREVEIEAISRYLALRGGDRYKGAGGVMVFAGPPASGKSAAARLLCEGLPGYKLWSYDCSAISSKHERGVFDGTPSSIMGSRPGELTDFVRRHPRSVIVLEHWDRMQPAAQEFLLPLLETGYLKDMYGFYEEGVARSPQSPKKIAEPEVDFRKTFLVLTVEAGAELYGASPLLAKLRREGGEAQVRTALEAALRAARNEAAQPPGPCFAPPVLSRLLADGLLLLFPPLDWQALRDICRDELAGAVDLWKARCDGHVTLRIEEEGREALVTMLVLAAGGGVNARSLSRETLLDRLVGDLFSAWLDGAPLPREIVVRVDGQCAAAVEGILAECGDDAPRTLFRTMRRLHFNLERNGGDDAPLILELSRPRLVKDSVGSDFQGRGGLLVELPEQRFADIAGNVPVKEALRRQIALLTDGRSLAREGYRPPGGILLHGPPGTGKTSLARAFAGEAGLPFMAITGPELLDLDGQRRMFATLRNYAPAVLFIDEIDALGRRGGGLDPAINSLLAEIDGFLSRVGEPIFVIGATNLPEKVDSALLRPGRIELVCEVATLDRQGRRIMLQRVADRLADGVSEALLDYSAGMSGAQIQAACREMVLHQGCLDEREARQLLEAQVFGERLRPLQEDERRLVAFHEAGHAVAFIIGAGVRIEYASLTAREGSVGHVLADHSGSLVHDLAKIKAMIAALLAGRVAQVLAAGDETALDGGAVEDLRRATKMAFSAIGHCGLDAVVGPISLPRGEDAGYAMPRTAMLVERRVKAWLAEAEGAARALLTKHWPAVQAVAEELLRCGAIPHERLSVLVEGQAARPKRAGRRV